LKNGGLKREGRAQKEKRGPSVSEAGNVIETHEHAGEFKSREHYARETKKPPRGETWRLIVKCYRLLRLY
jgi:hypothetical protein